MKLNIDQLSFWERKTYFENIDFTIVGAGIVGISAALELKKQHPKAKIIVLERGYLPNGASTKNAGFACFGSASEVLDDLKTSDEYTVWKTVERRWNGLHYLNHLLDNQLELECHGSWDIMLDNEKEKVEEIRDNLEYLNKKSREYLKENLVFSEDKTCAQKFGFKGVSTSFYNRLEGQLNTAKIISKLHENAIASGIMFLFTVEVKALQLNLYNVGIQTDIGFFKSTNVLICTNGFAKQLLPTLDVQPARAQVIVTSPIENLPLKGTFHYDKGYYYFRNVDNRVLLGGGRNLDFEGENSTELVTTEKIQQALHDLMQNVILPKQKYSIEYSWAGIMGVGATKEPIIQKLNDRMGFAVRMGGMGVAIGASVGSDLAKMF